MSLFSKSYIDWMSEVTNDGWNVLTITTHPDQLKPSVIGPVDVRGALRSVFEGNEFHHVLQVYFVCFQ